jgi:hypothetical protein
MHRAMPSCKATSTSGRPCESPALTDEEYCLWHHPDREAERQAASAKGGSAPRRAGVDLGKALTRPEILDDPMRVAALLESLVGGTVGGKVSPGTLRSVTYALRTVLAAIEAGDVKRRLEELEAAVKGIEEGRVRVPR